MDIIENTATPANPTQEEQLHSSSSAGHDNTAIDVKANVEANEDGDVNCGIRTNEKPISSTNSNTMYSDIDNNNDKKIDNLNNDNHNIMNESNDSSSSQQSETEIETEHFSSLFERADMNMNMNTNTSMNAHIDADVDVDGRLNAQAGLHVDVHVDDGNESSAEEEEEVIHQSQEEEGIDIPEEAEDRSNDSSHGHGHDDGGGIFPNNNTNTNNNTNNNNINNNNNRRTNNNNNILSYLIPILAILWHACMLWFRFFCSTITFSIPTKQLHIISIVLLCIHQIVQKIIEYIPHVWLMVFDIIGHEHMPQELKGFILSASSFGTGVMNGTGPGAGSGMAKSDSIVTEMEFLKLVLEKLIGQFLPNSTEVLQEIDGIGSGSSTSPSILKLLEKPIISIMIPTTILSIFLLITMTVFLCVHMSFQAFVYVSSYFSGDNEQGGVSLSSSPFVLWGILSILILETVLPWICLSVGVYLSFSVGGCIWSLFVVSMYLLWVGLRRLRSRVYLGTMPGEV